MKIATDFDGTLCIDKFPSIGPDIGAIPVLKELISKGHQLILNTMRSGEYLTDAVDWITENGIELYGINNTPGQSSWTSSPKVFANIYIDDAALGAPLIYDGVNKPYIDWIKVRELLVDRGIL